MATELTSGIIEIEQDDFNKVVTSQRTNTVEFWVDRGYDSYNKKFCFFNRIFEKKWC